MQQVLIAAPEKGYNEGATSLQTSCSAQPTLRCSQNQTLSRSGVWNVHLFNYLPKLPRIPVAATSCPTSEAFKLVLQFSRACQSKPSIDRGHLRWRCKIHFLILWPNFWLGERKIFHLLSLFSTTRPALPLAMIGLFAIWDFVFFLSETPRFLFFALCCCLLSETSMLVF